ncbi:MAG: hypothetical protein WBX14_12415, partial [Candidatus Udaeobacter sp.]
PVVYSVTPVRDCREAGPSPFGDVVANADDQIDLPQSALCCELPEPLAVHVQADRRLWIEQLNKYGKLKKIVYMHDVILRRPGTDRHSEGIE